MDLFPVTTGSVPQVISSTVTGAFRDQQAESLTDVVQRASAEFAVELLGSELAEVTNGEGPQVEDVVPGERFSLLQHHHLSPQQGQFDGSPQPTWPGTQHQTLRGGGRGSRRHRQEIH